MREFARQVGLGKLTGDAGAVALGQLSSRIYPLVSLPILSRIFGASSLGKLIFAMSIIQIVIYVVDFGFSMSALRNIAVARSPGERARVVGATLMAKFALYAVSVIALMAVIMAVEGLRSDWKLYAIGLALVIGEVAFPAWLLQGIGRLKAFALLTTVSRGIALCGLLLTVHTPDDLSLAILWQFAPMGISAIMCWTWLYRKGLARVQWVPFSEAIRALQESFPLFISTMTGMIMGTLNTIMLGFLSTPMQVAFFGTAERMSNAGLGVLGGVQESMLPRMTQAAEGKPDDRLRRTIMGLVAGAYCAGGIAIFAAAPIFIPWFLGPGYGSAVPVARILGIVLFVAGFTAVFTLALVARHQYRLISRITLITAAIHLCVLPFACIKFGAIGAALTAVTTELCLAAMLALAYRASNRQFAGQERLASIDRMG